MGRQLRHSGASVMPLTANSAHGFAAAHALVAYDSGSVYSFIPKNGCSTMRYSLALANGCISGPEQWSWIHANNHTFQASLRELVTAPFSFVILRCPHRRLASCFLDKILSRTQEFWALHRLTRDKLDPDKLSFRDFVMAISDTSMLRANIHWRPQIDFLVYEEYDAYYALEGFAQAIPEIENRAKISVHDARGLTNHATSQTWKQSPDAPRDICADMPLHELAALRREGRIPRSTDLYDAVLIEHVARLYAEDIVLYDQKFGNGDRLFPAFTQPGRTL
ncbi:sulfotransferase family 2 domain-containing protein [Limimaricola sp. AA108-03]|uniref:sulfotransferase family 2 domain-containing protein n=1 Tax=Limimaricola sp. AA108-03 TaxID=3425945 RepID=UPI003D780E78